MWFIIDVFSLLTEEIGINTFSDSRTPHIDKIKYLSLKMVSIEHKDVVNSRKKLMKKPIDSILFHLSTA